jgi:shikimate kinase
MKDDDKLVLVGMMGSGKTTVGRAVAKRLRVPFVDSDEQIEQRIGKTVREVFEQDGEAAFRQLEAQALREAVRARGNAVIAAAGGVVLDAHNRDLLRRAETVVWLRAAPDVLAKRAADGDHRPLLGDDPLGVMRRLDAERRPLYEEVASVAIDIGELSAEAVVDRIVELVERAA